MPRDKCSVGCKSSGTHILYVIYSPQRTKKEKQQIKRASHPTSCNPGVDIGSFSNCQSTNLLTGMQGRAQRYRQQRTHSTWAFLLSGNISPFQHELIKHLSSRDYPSDVSMQCSPVGCSVQKCLCTFFSDSLFTQRRLLSLSRSCSLTRSHSLLSLSFSLPLVLSHMFPPPLYRQCNISLIGPVWPLWTSPNITTHASLPYSQFNTFLITASVFIARVYLCFHVFVYMSNTNEQKWKSHIWCEINPEWYPESCPELLYRFLFTDNKIRGFIFRYLKCVYYLSAKKIKNKSHFFILFYNKIKGTWHSIFW